MIPISAGPGTILLAALTLASAPARAAAPFCEQTDLFRQGEGGVHTYRIPALIETRNGTLIAVADARYDNSRDLPGRIALVMRRSFDRGKTWSAAVTIRPAPEGGGVGDASLLLDRSNGRVWCFHAYGPPGIGFDTGKPGARTGPGTLQVHAMFSDDDGATWSAPTDLTPQIKDPAWRAVFATSGTHFTTKKGRFLVPLVVRGADGAVSARNAYSDDHGKTWRTGLPAGPATDESKAVELEDGTVLQNMRDGPRRAIARSRDGGITFGPLEHDPALIDPNCNAGLARCRFRGKKTLIFTNAASTTRKNVTVRLSFNGGRTWPAARVLHARAAAYSTVVPLRDGTVAVLYECGETFPAEKITFARFNLEWITSAAPPSGPPAASARP